MKKLYTVNTVKNIPGLGISGPLTTPMKMEFHHVLDMVKNGYKVYEHNPQDLTEKVLVTMQNINTIEFKNSRATAMNRRELNQSLIDDSKPMVINKITKTKKVESEPKEKEEVKDEPKKEKVSKPDEFSSNNK